MTYTVENSILRCTAAAVPGALLYLFMAAGVCFGQGARDLVRGNLIQFNDNGFWCWYQDERAVVDMKKGLILLGSAASGTGTGGPARNGANDAVMYDLVSGTVKRFLLAQWTGNCDDHNAPGFLIRPDGNYIAMYDQHYDNYVTRYRIFDGAAWAAEKIYDWRTKPGGIDYTLAYNNVYYLSAEQRMYDFQRANHRTPNFLVSADLGDTWTWGGQLTTNYSNSYNKGYYKYWSNGVDRIDFIFTEQHPRDTTTSIYHGYMKGGKAYRSDGTVVDDDVFDTTYIPTFKEFTKVFAEGTVMGNVTMRRCWQADLMRYDDGTIAAIITARSNDNTQGNDAAINPDHNFIYCRYDGTRWSYSYLAKAGKKMYSSEADYTGLAALCPNDPATVYISTPNDPRDTSISFGKREIWKGMTSTNGADWTWTPVTQNSVRDNFRPIVPLWDKNNTALLWCRGTYSAAQSFTSTVVGVLDRKLELTNRMTYVDASRYNTTLAAGAPLIATGPDATAGAADNKWHERTGVGNNNSLYTASEGAAENAPMLKTTIVLPQTGTCDIWVNFWANPVKDWRISAGVSDSTGVRIFRSNACKQVEAGDHTSTIVMTGTDGASMYQAYLGRVQADAVNDTVAVYIDDNAIRTGTNSTPNNDSTRTWYDGVSYAFVTTAPTFVSGGHHVPAEFALEQNYPNPFNPSTTITYSLPRDLHVDLRVYTTLGQEAATVVNSTMSAGVHSAVFAADRLASGVYFYKLTAGNYSVVKRMVLMK
jgi:hypothetical protein